MRKKIANITLATLMGLSCLMSVGCAKNEIIEDGLFKYTYVKKKDCYAIVGSTEELPKVVAPPAYFKGKEVRYLWYGYKEKDYMFSWNYLGLSWKGVEKFYFPYSCGLGYREDYETQGGGDGTVASILFFTKQNEQFLFRLIEWGKPGEKTVYFSADAYEKQLDYAQNYYSHSAEVGTVKWEVNENYAVFQYYKNDLCFQIEKANTSYLFNYEDAPNDGYFFINEFEYSEKIEDTPYEPIREGYTFGGWYKEAACTNEWNFDEDRLPQAEYDGEGNLQFVETKLYAKWIKK